VRKAHTRLRISAQLVDAAGGHCLWADHYELPDSGVFEVQDAIAQKVAGAVEPELLKDMGSAAGRRGPLLSSWDLVARGSSLFHHVTRPTHLKARDLFCQARQLDPELTEAHLWLGRVSAGLVAYEWADAPEKTLQEGQAAASQAVMLDEKNPYAHYALAIVSNYADDFELALRSAEKAIGLNPSFALAHLVHGMGSLYAGRSAEAVASLACGLRLNRYDPQNFVWCNLLAWAHLFGGEPAQGLQHAKMSLQIRPTWRPAMRAAAAACAALGRRGEATEWQRRWRETPALSGDALQPLWRCNPEWADEVERLLRG
jgi:tetratricopeptide (TPR) repeat protein